MRAANAARTPSQTARMNALVSAIHSLARRIFGFCAGLSLALVFAIVFVNALRRYTVGKSLEWGEELPIYLSIYGVMFGIGLAYLEDRHVGFTVVTDLLPDRVRRWLFVAVDLATLAIGLLLAWSGFIFAARRGALEASGLIGTAKALAETMAADWLLGLGQMATWQAAMGIGGVVLAIAAAIRLVARLREP